MKKRIIMILAVMLVAATLTVGVFASTGAVQVTLNYRDIKITLNGQEVQPKNACGDSVEPFIINGTTYLPVRAVSEALGLDVQWDEETGTIQLTETPSEAPANNLIGPEIPQAQNEAPSFPATDSSPAESDSESVGNQSNSGGQGNADNFDTYNAPEQQQTQARFVLNMSTKKIHHPHCRVVPQIAPENYATSNASLTALENQGFTLCGICHGVEPG